MADINLTRGGRKIHKALYMTDPKTVAIANATVLGSFTIKATALVHTMVVKLPTWSNDINARVSIENSNGDEVYANSNSGVYSLGRGLTHVLSPNKPLVGNNTVKITLASDPGGTGGNTVTTLYLIG